MSIQLIKMLSPSLASLVEAGSYEQAIHHVRAEQERAQKGLHDDAFTRNRHLSQLSFQQAVIAHAQGKHQQAFEYAKESFKYDVKSYPQHIALMEIAAQLQTDDGFDFMVEVAWWFSVSHNSMPDNPPYEFWAESDIEAFEQDPYEKVFHADADDVEALLEAHRHIPKIEQYLLKKALFYARIDRLDRADTNDIQQLEPIIKVCDEYRQKGLNVDDVKHQKTTILYKFKQYGEIVRLWQDDKPERINNLWSYARLMMSLIYTGKPLPDEFHYQTPEHTNDFYNIITVFLDEHRHLSEEIDDFDDDTPLEQRQRLTREKNSIERLLLELGNHALSVYQAVEQGDAADGYINWEHGFAMFCRNFSIVLENAGQTERALSLTEKGFSLSPFIENGRAMVNLAIRLKQYERAEKNISLVRRELEGYLNFYSMFHLASRELFLQAPKGKKAYFAALDAFQEEYGDFLHNMRINIFIDSTKRPSAVVDWTSTHNIYVGNVESAAELLYEQAPDDPEIMAYYFHVKSLTGNRREVEWMKAFAPKLRAVREAKADPNHKTTLFMALSALGSLKLRQGDYEDSQACYKEGIALLKEAVNLGVGKPRQVADCYLKMGRYLFLELKDYQTAALYLTKAIELLQQYGTKADRHFGFIGDPLLSLASWYRGKAYDQLPADKRPSDSDIADDFIRFCQLNDCKDHYLGAYEIVYLLTENEARLDELYHYGMVYIDTIEEMERDFPARGSVMSYVIMHLLLYKDLERALPLFDAYQKDFPKHEDMKRIKHEIAKQTKGKRKKFLGIF